MKEFLTPAQIETIIINKLLEHDSRLFYIGLSLTIIAIGLIILAVKSFKSGNHEGSGCVCTVIALFIGFFGLTPTLVIMCSTSFPFKNDSSVLSESDVEIINEYKINYTDYYDNFEKYKKETDLELKDHYLSLSEANEEKLNKVITNCNEEYLEKNYSIGTIEKIFILIAIVFLFIIINIINKYDYDIKYDKEVVYLDTDQSLNSIFSSHEYNEYKPSKYEYGYEISLKDLSKKADIYNPVDVKNYVEDHTRFNLKSKVVKYNKY